MSESLLYMKIWVIFVLTIDSEWNTDANIFCKAALKRTIKDKLDIWKIDFISGAQICSPWLHLFDEKYSKNW